jgi:hypothetical protein
MANMAAIVAFHAHPDDEALLTGGTLARLAAGGNRVVIAVACDGVMGEATGAHAQVRLDELRASASVLGAARVVHLGYADSGYGPLLYPDPPDRMRFARADVDEAAAKLAGLLRDEHAEVLLAIAGVCARALASAAAARIGPTRPVTRPALSASSAVSAIACAFAWAAAGPAAVAAAACAVAVPVMAGSPRTPAGGQAPA